MRLHAYAGLARTGTPALTTAVSQERLSEKDPLVQTAQAFALYRFGRKEYLEEVVKADRIHIHHSSQGEALRTADAVGAGKPGNMPRYRGKE